MRRPLRPVRVRAAAIVLALLAHVLLLLLFSFGRMAPREEAQLQFISIWPTDRPLPPPQPETTPAPQRKQRIQTPAPSNPPPILAPAAPVEPQAPKQEEPSKPAIDWYGEAARSAAISAAKGDQPSTFSPPPKVLRGPCKKKKSSFEWNPEEKKAGLLPLPFVRLGNCMIMLPFFACDLNGPPPANGHLFDDLKKGDRPVSSVPDPDTCD